MNGEGVSIWNEAVIACLKILLQPRPERPFLPQFYLLIAYSLPCIVNNVHTRCLV